MNYEVMKEWISEKKYLLLKDEFSNAQIADIAEFLDNLDEKNALLAFRLLNKEVAADVFSYLSIEKRAEISNLVNEKELADILKDLYFDDKIDLLEEMPANVVKKILRHTSEVERRLINQFLMYPEYSAGSLMTIEFVDLKKEMRVGDAIERIRQIAPDKETIYTCYVIDSERHLEGILSLKDLVLAPVDQKIGDIMKKEFIYVKTHDDQEYTADIFKKYDLLAVPVVDNESRLVGIITIDDIVDVIEDENTEDFYRMAAVEPTGEEYLSASVITLARKRFLWLMILMISATFTGFIITKYEEVLQSVVVLAAFIPMLMDTGGNAGSQASTLVIRSIVLGEVEFRHVGKVIWKEVRISLIVGIALSLVNFARIYFLEGHSFMIALTVSTTLIFTVMIAKVVGGILPIAAKKLRLDPAIMASPLITTIVDTLTLIIYFYFATLFLKL